MSSLTGVSLRDKVIVWWWSTCLAYIRPWVKLYRTIIITGDSQWTWRWINRNGQIWTGGRGRREKGQKGREGRGNRTITMDSIVSSSVSLREWSPTVPPAFTQLTISSICLHAYWRVCLMEHSYLIPVHCHMGIIFHCQSWGLELFWLTWGSSLWRTLALLLQSCAMGENIAIREFPHIFFQYILVEYIKGLQLNN